MQICKKIIVFLFVLTPFYLLAQSTYLNQGSKDYHFIDRLEIKQQNNTDLNFSALKPYNRMFIIQEVSLIDSVRLGLKDSVIELRLLKNQLGSFSKADEYNLRSLFMNNTEWGESYRHEFVSKHPVFHTFYKSKSNFFEINNKDIFLAVNPVLQVQFGKESDNEKRLYINTRGVTIRGRIGGRIGFSSTLTDNQERGASFYQQKVESLRAVPGVGFYKLFKKDPSAFDYFDGRGYLTFSATKFIDFQFGYDKNFIGNGFRSLFLSDWGNSYLFAKINTRIWKFNYQNLFMELMPQFKKEGDVLLKRKYSAMHHLSMNVTKWLNVGLFEGVMFGRKDHFDFQYLNPVIFYRHIEGTIGSPDNAVAGMDFKANVKHRFQFYGQFLMDEFILSQVRNNPTSWVNKFGFQFGGKYIDAFGVKNLDLQIEMNRVRPFTYSHFDTINNITHYNQPLAHPLGANFQEWIGILRYQPLPKLNIYARAIFYYQGLDTANANFGGNIFKSYSTRLTGEGFKVGSGNKATCLNGVLQASYELRQNLFLEAGVQYRKYQLATGMNSPASTTFWAGFRFNMFRREFDF
ncbi:MAG: hypothetical protein FGM46_00420 [Ferruginibacter sp.]|nr:hypothetical protein [Ferruginibacter sp.]